MEKEPELEISPLSQPLSSGGRTVKIEIYRLKNEPWALEIEDEFGNSTVWDETFKTDHSALLEAKKSILKEQVTTYIGPEDGKSGDGWK